MDKLIHADIFFFITTCALVLLTIILAIVFSYGVFIAKNINHIVKRIKEQSDNISEDIEVARQKIKDQGLKFASIIAFIKSLSIFNSIRKSRKKSTKKEESSESEN